MIIKLECHNGKFGDYNLFGFLEFSLGFTIFIVFYIHYYSDKCKIIHTNIKFFVKVEEK